MLSKPATMLLGFLYEKPLNAYEIIKLLNYMNVKWWFHIADSTVYSTLKTLEKKEFISGTTKKVGNMPDRTVYKLSDKGKIEFVNTLKASILQFNYDTNIFSIAAFFLSIFSPDKQQELLQERLTILQKYRAGIEKQINKQNETFAIFPYEPHSISAHDNYTLLTLCIDKNAVTGADVTTTQKHITFLLMQALNMGKISQYQILQLLNCLDETSDPSNWQLKNHTPYIHDLKKQLELYPECKLTVEKMAQNVFLSKYHFIRSFKAEVGLTPHQFQIQNRIRKAQRLIHETDTITEVALTTGFCDQSHFIKQFEKYVGLPPLTYKYSSGIIPQNTSIPSGALVPFGDTKEI